MGVTILKNARRASEQRIRIQDWGRRPESDGDYGHKKTAARSATVFLRKRRL
jgi:hypothetical protein